MKCFFIIALLCASVVSFGQDTRTTEPVCFVLKSLAVNAATQAAVINYFANPDEAYVSTDYQWHAGQGWCYTNTYQCVLPPLNKESVPEVAKVIQSQTQIDCAMIPYERKIE